MTTPESPAPGRRLWAPYAVLAGVIGVVACTAVVDPNQPGHYPTCPFLLLTGYYCPGCGSLRMLHALTHGHVTEGFGHNPLAFVALPMLGYLWVRWEASARRGRPFHAPFVTAATIIVFLLVTLVFWVVRNLPIGHALAP